MYNVQLAKIHADNQKAVKEQRAYLHSQLEENLSLMEQVSLLRADLQTKTSCFLQSCHQLASLQTHLNAIDQVAQTLQAIFEGTTTSSQETRKTQGEVLIQPEERVSITQQSIPLASPPKTSSSEPENIGLFDETIFDLEDPISNTLVSKKLKRYTKRPRVYSGTLDPIHEEKVSARESAGLLQEGSELFKRPRRSVTRVSSYTEPSLNSKLRKGDPFTSEGL